MRSVTDLKARTLRCSVCQHVKSLDTFYQRRDRGRQEWQHECKACGKSRTSSPEYRAQQRERYRKDPQRLKDQVLRSTHGLTQGQLNWLRDNHGDRCAICDNPETAIHQSGTLRDLAIDHDHKASTVRGMLCSRCNTGIGLFRDNPELLRQAIEYLETADLTEALAAKTEAEHRVRRAQSSADMLKGLSSHFPGLLCEEGTEPIYRWPTGPAGQRLRELGIDASGQATGEDSG